MCLKPRHVPFTVVNGVDGTAPEKVPDENPLCTKKDSVSVQDRTTALVRGLRLVMRHHGCHGHLIDLMNKQMRRYLDTAENERDWLKRAKHALTYPLAKYLRNELPESPACGRFEPSGGFRKWWKSRLVAFNRKNTHFWYSWLQGKRSTLPAGVDMIEKTYQDHLAVLTSLDDGDEDVIESIFSDPTFAYVIRKLKYQVAKKLAEEEEFIEFTPSGSACFEKKRSEQGQFGQIREEALLEFTLTDEFVGMREVRSAPSALQRHYGTHVESMYVRSGRDEWSGLVQRDQDFPTDQRLRCIIQGILEPMKVRVISKGESIPYYSMKPVQKVIHGIMRRWDCFRLIGRPFSPTDMVDLKEMSQPDWEWFSIDYSAATDGLSYKYSGGILEEILENIPPHQYRRAMQVLGMHDLYYPDKHEVYGFDRVTSVTKLGTMSRGQLMGSILSFPILCLANLGLYLLVTQDLQKGWTHKERLRHVLINGDDMLYAAPVELWERHIRLGKSVGLNMTVGKAYHHSTYANVNSTSIHYRLGQNDTPFQIDFLNSGLFFGQHKVQGGVDGESLSVKEEEGLAEFFPDHLLDERSRFLLKNVRSDPGIISSIDCLLKGSLPSKASSLLAEYLVSHADAIERTSMALFRYERKGRKKVSLLKRNLFMPTSLGGMGVSAPCDFKYKVSPFERRVARCSLKMRRTTSEIGFALPVKGHLLTEDILSAPWIRPSLLDDGCVVRGLTDDVSNFQKVSQFTGLHSYRPIAPIPPPDPLEIPWNLRYVLVC